MGKLLAERLNTLFLIDGDEFRHMFTNKNYGKEGREENIKNANAVATYLNKKSSQVVVCLVNPYDYLRKELKNNNQDQVIEVFLNSKRELRKEYHVEDFEIGNPHYIINTDQETEETWEQLKDILKI